jgi:hypothetical protein
MTRRMAAFAVGLLLAFGLLGTVQAATPNVGFHQHVAFTDHPVDGVPIPRAPRTIHGTIVLHNYTGHLDWFRVSDGSNVKQKINVSLGPCTDCTLPFSFTVDFSSWSVGRHELRWSSNDNDALPGKRQYTTSRYQVCIVSCSPNVGGRAANFLGGGGWYEGNDYVIALLTSPRSTVAPGGTISLRSQYSRSKALCVYLNPNFHAGSSGTTLGCWGAGTSTRTLTLPSSLGTGDNVVIVSHDGKEAGVLHLKVNQPQYVESQAWWAQSGLVLP